MKANSPKNIPALFAPVTRRVESGMDPSDRSDTTNEVGAFSNSGVCSAIPAQMCTHGSSTVWLPRNHKRLGKPRKSYVYLLVHQTQNRFKIGKSIDPKTRFENLPEAREVDKLRSLQVLLPNQRRAGQIESMLHKALAHYRLAPLSWLSSPELGAGTLPVRGQAGRWDGATEWFALPAFRRAIEILKLIPELTRHNEATWQTLEGEPWQDRSAQSMTLKEQHLKEVEQYNLDQFEDIFDVLITINWHNKMVWLPSASPELSAGTLRIVGFKAQWDPAVVAARFNVTSSALWELRQLRGQKTHQRIHAKKIGSIGSQDLLNAPVCPLVKLIAYSKTYPEDLELVTNSAKAISKVPGGKLVLQRWLGFSEGLRE